ncbi:isoprenylcysteine carboxylmethyltransferase family protein [Aureimonas altamirensis]|uniref:methyltransferase family protein n=1 Tax=Aureimonas altamirensis TaxID=370622 RepID=UPI0020374929|nr:isoprenylcysteine carboxylmethyltransferase family protein [Aureimonas altamirensis]MCM2505700.1 isoprenylcysteine carboxylmethyltransferase family protein [Aureimonas altamirensis]
MTVDAVLRFAPVVLLVLVGLWLLLATRRTSRAIGINAYGFGGTRRQRTAQFLFRLGVGGGLLAAAAFAARIAWPGLQPLSQHVAHQALGLFIATCGLGLIVIAQTDMGRRWRVGVPTTAPDELVTCGLFRYSRNPVFVGMLAMALGLSIAVLSPPMIAAAICFWLACELQVRDEERFLEGAFGDVYRSYKREVRRWI